MPKISIIIPCYNSEQFIDRTIKSVLSQTFSDWELLLIDDHSTDKTKDILEKYAKNDTRIKILQTKENSGGPALPKNIGIENAKGEYIAFLDHDDEWLPEKLEKQLAVFENSKDEKLGLVSCYFYIKDISKNRIIKKYKNMYKKDILKELLKINFIYTSSCVMVKSFIFKKIGLFDTNYKITDDLDMWLKIAKNGYHFDYSPFFLLNYIYHKDNLCYAKDNKNYSDFIKIYEKYKNDMIMYEPRRLGSYFYYQKKYRESRKYFIKGLFKIKYKPIQRMKSLAFLILSFFPFLEIFFRKINRKINKL